MIPARAIVATPFANHLSILQRIVGGMPEIKIVAHAPGLMELFSAVENDPPNLVIVSDDLAEQDDFKSLFPLFDALDVRWIKFKKDSGIIGQNFQTKPQTVGVFGLSLDQTPHAIRLQLKSLLSGARRPDTQSSTEIRPPNRTYARTVLIGSSTGGVEALKTILSHFDENCPPTVVVQHTTQRFGNGLPAILSKVSRAKIRPFEPNLRVEPGTVYILAGQDKHVVLSGRNDMHLTTCDSPPMSGHRPSIDKLFLSAVPCASKIAAAVLTGMGKDGANGLLALRNAGAKTLAQDESSSVVYGMPAAAWSNGGAEKQVALQNIGSSLLSDAIL